VTPALAHLFTDKEGFGWLSEDDFVHHFAADVDPVRAKVMYAVQQALASSAFTDVMGVPAWRRLGRPRRPPPPGRRASGTPASPRRSRFWPRLRSVPGGRLKFAFSRNRYFSSAYDEQVAPASLSLMYQTGPVTCRYGRRLHN
jgi:hypothetical protein